MKYRPPSSFAVVPVVCAGALLLGAVRHSAADVVVVRSLPAGEAGGGNKHYVTNRAPLKPSPAVKLPIGSITPRGWLRGMLELEAKGMTGRLPEISQWCKFEGNAWVSPDGKGHSPWEELPYWLKGYGDLGYVLKDEKITAEAKKWIEGILSSQREDGWFGPRELLGREGGKPDLWPPMLALNVLQSYYEATGDERVIPFMTKYFRWQLDHLKDEDFLAGYWPKPRGGDNLESVYWLYNRTGEPWLLKLADKIHRHTSDWTSGIINQHGVNITQGFREPVIYWMQAGDERFLKAAYRNYDAVMGTYGQMPGGMFVADENFREGYTDPRGAAETCSMVEFMHSFEMLTRITGDPVWSDRCEDVAFNSLPAATTPDLRALHYLTAANQVLLDPKDKNPGIQNSGPMFGYSPFEVYRCCQHNFAHGWPYFAEEMWVGTADDGLCASLYAPSEVSAKVGDNGAEVTVSLETRYPFGDTIELKLSAARPARFPLYLRVPGWCAKPELKVNGTAAQVEADGKVGSPAYLAITREWKDGDTVSLRLPMTVAVRTWERNKNAVSVDRGPLTYSLRIGEDWKIYGDRNGWKAFEVHPSTPWNYGLVLKKEAAADSFEVVQKQWAASPKNPLNQYDVELKAKARKIPNWKTDARGLIQPLQQGPAKSGEPVETVTLIPMGAARLRITAFPTVDNSPNAWEWIAPPTPPLASHVWQGDTTEALNDGREPKGSNDQSIPRFTWWNHLGTEEWVQYDFDKPRNVSSASVYWFDDRAINGGCRVPESWEVLYQDPRDSAGGWKPVKALGAYGVARDAYNKVEFDAVETKALRVRVKLQDKFSGGILEWRVE